MLLILLILIFFLIILLLPINISIEYSRKDKDDNFILNIYIIFKFLGVRIKIPYLKNSFFKFFTEIDSILMNLWPWRRKIELKKEINWKDLQLKRLKELFNLLANREMILLIFNSLHIKCKKLSWKTEFGFENPALTGITNGFFWALKGLVLTIINELICQLYEPEVELYPDFYHKKFNTRFQGIFSILIGNIILTMIKVVFYKLKGGFRSWGNIQLKN